MGKSEKSRVLSGYSYWTISGPNLLQCDSNESLSNMVLGGDFELGYVLGWLGYSWICKVQFFDKIEIG